MTIGVAHIDLDLLSHIHQPYPRYIHFLNRFIMPLMFCDTLHVVLDRLIWIPPNILGKVSGTCGIFTAAALTSGDEILTLRILARTIS